MKHDHGRKYRFATRAIHAGHRHSLFGEISVPIYQTSSFSFPDVQSAAARFSGQEEGYIYSRLGNPTVTAFEERIAALENAESAVAFASGMAAISGVFLGLTGSGDHILAARALYGASFTLLSSVLPEYGIEVSFVDMDNPETVKSSLRDNTRLIYFESPTNPTLSLVDIGQIAAIGRDLGVITVIDNTFMTPYFQRPIELGIDLVVHSTTKYIGGHGDVIGGVVAGPERLLSPIRKKSLKLVGGVMAPFSAWLLLRGLQTLPVRMEKHNSNSQIVAQFLSSHPKVEKVYYPGLPDSPYYDLARKQMSGFGGVVSFEVKGGVEAGKRLLNAVKLCHLAVSLGDVATLIEHPASMTHASVPREARVAMGINDGLIRLAVGIEDHEDIIEDLAQALAEI